MCTTSLGFRLTAAPPTLMLLVCFLKPISNQQDEIKTCFNAKRHINNCWPDTMFGG